MGGGINKLKKSKDEKRQGRQEGSKGIRYVDMMTDYAFMCAGHDYLYTQCCLMFDLL